MRSQAELESYFAGLAVDCSQVEFYNQPAFHAAERQNPLLLESYAELVEARSYDAGYLDRARRLVPKVTAWLRRELAQGGLEGACAPCSLIVSKILERLGIWNYVAAGSLTVQFDPHTSLPTQHWAHLQACTRSVGHAWIVAPPFRVIDLTVGLQTCNERIKPHLPELIVAEECEAIDGVSLDDLLHVDIQRQLLATFGSLPTVQQVIGRKPEIAHIMRTFPPRGVRVEPILAKYIPCCIMALEERFEDVRASCFAQRRLPALFADLVRQTDLDGCSEV